MSQKFTAKSFIVK